MTDLLTREEQPYHMARSRLPYSTTSKVSNLRGKSTPHPLYSGIILASLSQIKFLLFVALYVNYCIYVRFV